MAAFDPDAYLSQKSSAFDPDAYLATANPVATDNPSTIATIGAGFGKATGDFVLGGQKLLGVGIKKLGGDSAGDWLINDANEGKAKLARENQLYKEANPITSGAAEIAGDVLVTLPVGGVVAKGLTKVAPVITKVAPSAAPALDALTNAIRTSGMTTGVKTAPGVVPALQNLGIRSVGGAVTGGVSAALLNPEDAQTGALIGAAAPGVIQVAGKVGNVISNVIKGPGQSADAVAAIKAARDLGYVIPPTQASPTLVNRVLEGLSGKITTAQNASAKNASVTNSLAAKALGLAEDTKITPEVLSDVRKTAGQAYDAIANTGTITPAKTYTDALDKIADPYIKAAQGFPGAKPSPVLDLVESLKSPSFDASSAIEKIKQLRSAADDAFRTGNTDVARASKAAAKALEDAAEEHVTKIGQPELLEKFRNARQLYAKTYSVEKAVNQTTGTVDARKLGAQLERGKPLSGELRQAGEFANRFKKAAQTPESMGSLPQTSPLDWAAGGVLGAATSNPLSLAAIGARPMARKLILSNGFQNRLTQQPGNKLADLLSNQQAQQIFYKSAPVAIPTAISASP